MNHSLKNAHAMADTTAVMNLAWAQEAILAECLLWHPLEQRWWWTDIESSSLHCWSTASVSATESAWHYKLTDRVGSFAHCRSGRLLLGMAKWLCFTNPIELAATMLKPLPVIDMVAVDPAEARTRINDGRTDRHGNFVFGTMNEAKQKRPIGSFYQYSMRHGLRRLALPAVAIANSICFSIDGATMYFSDTLTRRIMQCDYDSATAQVSNIRRFVEVADVDGVAAYPDGSVIDRDGCLWNAQWGAARVVQYAPDGTWLRSIIVPVKNPTCPAFGGVNLDVLMVASSRQEMSSDELAATPYAGSLFGLTLSRPTGIAETLFDDSSAQ